MSRKENKIYVTAAFIICIAGLFSMIQMFALMARSEIEMNMISSLSAISNGVALVFAFGYLFSGYMKSCKNYYYAFTVSYGVAILLCTISSVKLYSALPLLSMVFIPALTLIYGSLMTLTLSRNLGKKKSIIISFTNIVLIVAVFILSFAKYSSFDGKYLLLAGIYQQLCLAFVLFVCTKSKYADKSDRGAE